MGGLFGALANSLSAIEAFQNALDVTQNNVSNATTPGYANQIATFEAQSFDPQGGLDGGGTAGPPMGRDHVAGAPRWGAIILPVRPDGVIILPVRPIGAHRAR